MHKVSAIHAHQRPIEQMDYGLIYNSLLKSYQQQGYGTEGIDKDLFFANHKKSVEKMLQNCVGICAVNPEDHDLIYAYILFEEKDPVLHYVYVKTSFRNMGFATWLIETVRGFTGPINITHRTQSFRRFIEPKGQFTFNPYLLGELHGSSTSKECEAG